MLPGCKKTEPPPAPPPAAAAAVEPVTAKSALRIAYSDWPGWTAFEVGIQKGWFKQAGVDVEFEWLEYAPSMDAFSAGKVDAVAMTNGDTLVTGSKGPRGIEILVTDYSNGNDMVVALPGTKSLKQLKGKKIGLEVGLVEHLLLLKGLEKFGMRESDVEIVNTATQETAKVLASKEVQAIAAWQPNSGAALKAVAGSKAIWTSADAPGLIYDTLAVSPKSLSERRADWVKVVKVWNRIEKFVTDPATQAEAAAIMAGRAGVPADEYAKFLPGTRFLAPEEALKVFEKRDDLTSLYGSSKVADAFNVANKVYATAQPIDAYIDSSLSREAAQP